MFQILPGTYFSAEMIGLLKPLIDDHVKKFPYVIFEGKWDAWLRRFSFLFRVSAQPALGYGITGANVLVPLLRKFGFGVRATQYPYCYYKKKGCVHLQPTSECLLAHV